MARTQLPAVVHVFCLSSSSTSASSSSAAAQRLARTLVVTANTIRQRKDGVKAMEDYYTDICQQAFAIPDTVIVERKTATQNGDTNGSLDLSRTPALTQSQHDRLQFVWALLEALPDHILMDHVLQTHFKLCSRAVYENDKDPQRSREEIFCDCTSQVLHRLGTLLSSPASTLPSHVRVLERLVLTDCKDFIAAATTTTTAESSITRNKTEKTFGSHLSLFGILMRLASMPTIQHSQAKADALFCIHMILERLVLSGSNEKNGGHSAFAAVALVYAVAPTNWDLKGNQFQVCSAAKSMIHARSGEKKAAAADVSIVQREIHDLSQISKDVEERMTLAAKQILATASPVKAEQEEDSTQQQRVYLTGSLFQLLLSIYFSSKTKTKENGKQSDTLGFFLLHDTFRLVAMVGLPIICEICPAESLFLVSKDSADNTLLEMIKLVLHGTWQKLQDQSPDEVSSPSEVGSSKQDFSAAARYASAAGRMSAYLQCDACRTLPLFRQEALDGNMDTILSMASLMLSFLVSILELGSKQRGASQEAMLQSFTDVLRHLAEVNPLQISCEILSNDDSRTVLAQIAEMASHALALLASRSVAEEETDDSISSQDQRHHSTTTTPLDVLSQARHDLASLEPPLRARGMVSLRHLASSLAEQRGKPAIQLVVPLANEDSTSETWLESQILGLAIQALSDNESYVFLAAIHTIAVLVDASPSRTIPQLGQGVATGDLRQVEGLGKLSAEQRVKLAEALIAALSRRASNYEYLPWLVECMIYGSNFPAQGTRSPSDGLVIRDETHSYFLRGSRRDGDKKVEDDWDAQEIRMKAGGPLFASEESDVVRGAAIGVVATLVSKSAPAVVAKYCNPLLLCCMDLLRSDITRPAMRAAALLAREMYACLLRECEEEMAEGRLYQAHIPFAVAMVSSGEENLFAALTRCCSAEDMVHGRVFDPATVARCEEATIYRTRADNGGVLAAACIIASARSREDNSYVRRLLERDELAAERTTKIRIEELH